MGMQRVPNNLEREAYPPTQGKVTSESGRARVEENPRENGQARGSREKRRRAEVAQGAERSLQSPAKAAKIGAVAPDEAKAV